MLVSVSQSSLLLAQHCAVDCQESNHHRRTVRAQLAPVSARRRLTGTAGFARSGTLVATIRYRRSTATACSTARC